MMYDSDTGVSLSGRSSSPTLLGLEPGSGTRAEEPLVSMSVRAFRKLAASSTTLRRRGSFGQSGTQCFEVLVCRAGGSTRRTSTGCDGQPGIRSCSRPTQQAARITPSWWSRRARFDPEGPMTDAAHDHRAAWARAEDAQASTADVSRRLTVARDRLSKMRAWLGRPATAHDDSQDVSPQESTDPGTQDR